MDADRLKRMPPDTFEKFLPYAMALGVEHHWAQAFAGIVKNPPSWYVSPQRLCGFTPLFFSSAMHGMATDMHQVFVSAPRASSGGSGFGGGFGPAEASAAEGLAAAAEGPSKVPYLWHIWAADVICAAGIRRTVFSQCHSCSGAIESQAEAFRKRPRAALPRTLEI